MAAVIVTNRFVVGLANEAYFEFEGDVYSWSVLDGRLRVTEAASSKTMAVFATGQWAFVVETIAPARGRYADVEMSEVGS